MGPAYSKLLCFAPVSPPLTANFMQCFDGFGLVAPCKGNGISAQGKAGRRTATPWVPPPRLGLKSIAPCKGNTSSIGATPRRQTSANQTTNVRKSNDKRPQTERKPSVIAKLRPTCNRKIKHKSITIYVIFCDMNLLILQLHNHSNKTHSKP